MQMCFLLRPWRTFGRLGPISQRPGSSERIATGKRLQAQKASYGPVLRRGAGIDQTSGRPDISFSRHTCWKLVQQAAISTK